VKKSDHLSDILREVQIEIKSFHSMSELSVIAVQLQDVRISEDDQIFAFYKNSAWKGAIVSSSTSRCHDGSAALPWSAVRFM